MLTDNRDPLDVLRLEEAREEQRQHSAGGTMLAKCANPACPVRFDRRQEGKLFYFNPAKESEGPGRDQAGARFHLLNIEHYWLCELCARIFTLVVVDGDRVMLTPRCPAAPAEDSPRQSRATS